MPLLILNGNLNTHAAIQMERTARIWKRSLNLTKKGDPQRHARRVSQKMQMQKG